MATAAVRKNLKRASTAGHDDPGPTSSGVSDLKFRRTNAARIASNPHLAYPQEVVTISKSDQNDLSVVRAKLHAPRIPSDLVCRDRLHELLAKNPGRPFTLVSAPAGYGKSTLVAHWLTAANLPGTWFSLEESDNDVRQFLTYVIAAVRKLSRKSCGTTLSLLRAPELPPLALLREQLSNDLDAIRKPFLLVLDDFHRVDRTEVHEIINHLLDLPPRSLHLVIVTRHDPPVELNKLRADGRMVDVRERDLRFT